MLSKLRIVFALAVAMVLAFAIPSTTSAFSSTRAHPVVMNNASVFQCDAYRDAVAKSPGITNWWHLGDTGNTAIDSATGPSATPYNLSYRNSPTRGVTRTSMESDGSISLNGTTQFVDANTQRFNFSGKAVFSVEGWAYISSNPKNANPRILSAENLTQLGNGGGRYGWTVAYQKASTSLRFERWDNATAQRTYVTLTKLDAWHHFAASFDGTTMRFYVDGVAAPEDSNTISMTPLASNYGLRIGGTAAAVTTTTTANSSEWWTGGLDEITFYNRALTATEAYDHATARCNYTSVTAHTTNAENVWNLDEVRNSTTVADSKQSATCSVTGPMTLGDTSGLPSGAGTSATMLGGRFTCPTATQFNGNSPFSAEIWVKMGQFPSSKAYIMGNKVPGADGWSIYANPDGRLVFDRSVGGAATSITSSSAIGVGAWHMITATFNGTSGALYFDNNVVGGSSMNTSINSTAALVIGAATNAVSPWIGGLDNASIYSRALSTSEINAHWVAR